jgi:hypothetical protein
MTSGSPSVPSLPYDTAGPPGDGGWPPETKAIVAAAAVVSLLALLTWGGSLWRYLQPSAFRGTMILEPWPSVDFALFVLRGAMSVAVMAGALVALGSRNVARRVLLVAALTMLAIALYQFATFSVFQTGLTRRREGPDQVYWLVDDGSRLVTTHLVYGLMVLALTRQSAATASLAGPRPWITQVIVAAAAVDCVVHVAATGANVWVALQPSLFKTIGSGAWTSYGITMLVVRVLLYLLVITGAAAALAWRRHRLGRRLLLLGAGGLVALALYFYVESFVATPPPGFPRYKGAERVTNAVYDVGRVITMEMIHVLVLFALTRRHVRGGAAAGTTGGDALPRVHD